MRVIVGIPESVFNSEDPSEERRFFAELTRSVQSFGDVRRLEPTPVGMGASFPSYLVEFVLENWEQLAIAFLAGEKIVKNVEAWRKIWTFVNRTIVAIRKTFRTTIDYDAAAVLACDATFAELAEAHTVRMKSVTVVNILTNEARVIKDIRREFPKPDLGASGPDALTKLNAFNSEMHMNSYVFLIEVNDRDVYSIVVENDGLVRTPTRVTTQ